MESFYCSNCNASVKKEDITCSQCGADLSEIIDDLDSQNTVVIKTYINKIEAETAKEYLENSGIETYISKDDAGGMYPHHFGGINSYRVVVLESNVDKALIALESLENSEANLDEDIEDL